MVILRINKVQNNKEKMRIINLLLSNSINVLLQNSLEHSKFFKKFFCVFSESNKKEFCYRFKISSCLETLHVCYLLSHGTILKPFCHVPQFFSNLFSPIFCVLEKAFFRTQLL